MDDRITDIWFRSGHSLAAIAQRLELQDVTEDAEKYWEWVIGSLGEVQLDVTRTHTQPRHNVETRIFVLGNAEFSEALIAELVGRLRAFIRGPISCGRWEYRGGNDFDLVVVREFGPANGADPA